MFSWFLKLFRKSTPTPPALKLGEVDEHKRTRLHIAFMEKKDEQTIAQLLAEGEDPNAKDCENSTPLHYAADHDHKAAIPLLINRGARPNEIDMFGEVPLHVAVSNGFVEMVFMLLKSGADPFAENADGKTSLLLAAEAGNLEVMNALLNDKRVREHPETGEYLAASNNKLLRAAISKRRSGELASMNRLLSFGAVVANVKGHEEELAMMASRSANPIIFNRLKKLPAFKDYTMNHGLSYPADIAPQAPPVVDGQRTEQAQQKPAPDKTHEPHVISIKQESQRLKV